MSPTPPSDVERAAATEGLPSASPAPFLAHLRASRSVAPADAPSPAAPSAAPAARANAPESSDDLDAMSDAPPADESFESATTIISRAVLTHRDVERDDDTTPIAAAKPAPSLEAMVAKIPAETQDALDQLFRARFRAVRRITPDQLR